MGGLLLACAVVGGVAGGFVEKWQQQPYAKACVSAAQALKGLDGLDDRLAAVENAVLDLARARNPELAHTKGHDLPTGTAAQQQGMNSNNALSDKIGDPVFDEAVRDSLERTEANRAAARQSETRQLAAQRRSDQTTRRLSLNDDQKAKVTELAVEYSQKVGSVSGTEGKDSEMPAAQVRSLREQYDQRLTAVLSDSQLISYRAMAEKLRFGRELGP